MHHLASRAKCLLPPGHAAAAGATGAFPCRAVFIIPCPSLVPALMLTFECPTSRCRQPRMKSRASGSPRPRPYGAHPHGPPHASRDPARGSALSTGRSANRRRSRRQIWKGSGASSRNGRVEPPPRPATRPPPLRTLPPTMLPVSTAPPQLRDHRRLAPPCAFRHPRSCPRPRVGARSRPKAAAGQRGKQDRRRTGL